MRALTLVTGPTVEPVGLDEAKDHLRLDGENEDRRLRGYLKAARVWAEHFTRRALISQTWDLKVDTFGELLYVPLPPLQSVTSISYVDDNGDSQTVTSTIYTVDTDSDPGRIFLAYDQSWPSHRSIPNAVTARIVVGYGAVADNVPEDIRTAILLRISRLYEFREPVITGTIVSDTESDLSMLRPYQLPAF